MHFGIHLSWTDFPECWNSTLILSNLPAWLTDCLLVTHKQLTIQPNPTNSILREDIKFYFGTLSQRDVRGFCPVPNFPLNNGYFWDVWLNFFLQIIKGFFPKVVPPMTPLFICQWITSSYVSSDKLCVSMNAAKGWKVRRKRNLSVHFLSSQFKAD